FTSPEQARKLINGWVAEHTNNKIKDLLAPPYPYPGTPLILTNAIYFKGRWAEPFLKAATSDGEFTTQPGAVTKVPMMHRVGTLRYRDGGTFHAVELPYAGDALAMDVLVPKKVDGLAELEQSLDAGKVAALLSKFELKRVSLSLPRFKIE